MTRVDHSPARGLAVLLLSCLLPALAHADVTLGRPPAGHLRTLPAHRAVDAPVIDGRLDDRAWQDGAIAEGFWVSDSQRLPEDETRVVVMYDDRALYFAFTCFDREPERIRASQLVRDAAPGLDDRVIVELDPYHNHRSVSRFTVTARGTQSDAIAGGRAGKPEWKGSWSAAVARTPGGWTAEVAIPLEVLAFDPQTDTFGLNFSRYQNRTKQWSEWADLTPQRRPEEAGHLTGLQLPRSESANRLSAMQYVSAGTASSPGDRLTSAVRSGIDVRYQWQRTLTLMVSARPDFSDTIPDVAGAGFSYNEKFVADRRPFFQEGASFFGSSEVFHSGRIEQFDVGVKTFGRMDDQQIGILATTSAGSGRTDYVGRVVREIGPAFDISATLVGRNTKSDDRRTVQMHAGGRVGRHVRVAADVARSSTAADRSSGMRGRAEVAYERAHWRSGGWIDESEPEYVPVNAFVAADVIGTHGRGVYGGYNRASGGGWLRRTDGSLFYEVRDTVTGARQRETVAVYGGAETASDIHVNAGMTVGSYRPRTAAVTGWGNELSNDRFYLASAYYQKPDGQFGYGAQYSGGVASLHAYNSLTPSVWLAPSPHLSLSYSFERAEHDAVHHQHVLSGTWTMNDAQAFSARWVEYDGGYYRVSYRRTVGRGIDAVGVYSSDPYVPRKFDVKVVWTLLAGD